MSAVVSTWCRWQPPVRNLLHAGTHALLHLDYKLAVGLMLLLLPHCNHTLFICPPKNTGECTSKGSMAVVPRRGDALLFWDMHPNGTDVDRASLHASCPTLKVWRGGGSRAHVLLCAEIAAAYIFPCFCPSLSESHQPTPPPPPFTPLYAQHNKNTTPGHKVDCNQVDPQQALWYRL